MSSWPVIAGAFAAALLAWAAIAAVAWVGQRQLDTRWIRWLGAAALGLIALDIAGVPVPWALPPTVMALGLLGGLASSHGEDAEA